MLDKSKIRGESQIRLGKYQLSQSSVISLSLSLSPLSLSRTSKSACKVTSFILCMPNCSPLCYTPSQLMIKPVSYRLALFRLFILAKAGQPTSISGDQAEVRVQPSPTHAASSTWQGCQMRKESGTPFDVSSLNDKGYRSPMHQFGKLLMRRIHRCHPRSAVYNIDPSRAV